MKLRVLICIWLLITPLGAQEEIVNLAPLGEDISTLLTGIGRDIVPALHLNSFGGDVMGQAFSEVPYYINFPSLGITGFDGLASVLGDDGAVWKFFYSLPSIIEDNLTDASSLKNYETVQEIMVLPVLKAGMGFSFANGVDLHITGMYLPPLDFIPVALLENIHISSWNTGVRLRKSVLPERGKIPSFSIGAGYNYSSFTMDIIVNSITDFMSSRFTIEGLGDLDFEGELHLASRVHSWGLDFHLSKKLSFFTPFIRFSPYMYYAFYNSSAHLDASLYEEGTDTLASHSPLSSEGSVSQSGLSFVTTLGCEIKVFMVVFHGGLSFDIRNTVLTPGKMFSLEFHETRLNNVCFNLGGRVEF